MCAEKVIGFNTNGHQDLFRVMQLERKMTYKRAANRLNVTGDKFKDVVAYTKMILERITAQPEKDLFLEEFFKTDVVQTFMFGMAISETTFRQYIHRFTIVKKVPDMLRIEQKTQYGIEVLRLNLKTYRAIMTWSRIRTIKDLMVISSSELANMREISKIRRLEIEDALYIWCVGQQIPIDHYAHLVISIDKPFAIRYPYDADVAISELHPPIILKEALEKINNMSTINDVLRLSEKEWSVQSGIGKPQLNQLKECLALYFDNPINRKKL